MMSRRQSEAQRLLQGTSPNPSGYGAALAAGDPEAGGLTSEEAAKLLKEVGPNELEPQPTEGFFSILLTQMGNMVFLLTASAALICYITGDKVKGTFLICLVVIVCVANAIGEYSGLDASDALMKLTADKADVLRDGAKTTIPVKELVPGDCLFVKRDTIIPADMRVIQSLDLQTNESMLTGEPKEVTKTREERQSDSAFPSNMLYKSTDVVAGSGMGLVTATGMRTEVGLIAKRLKTQDNQSLTEKLNPLQRSINVLGRIIGLVCAIVIICGALLAFLTGYQDLPPKCTVGDKSCLLYNSAVRGLLMAVSIIPHGLPLVVMVMLAVGSSLMLERNAMVTRKSAVDYLGAMHVICTDKTGTLTEGKMTATKCVSFIQSADSSASPHPTEIVFYPQKGLDPRGGVYASGDLTDEFRNMLDNGADPSGIEGLHDLCSPFAASQRAEALLARLTCAASCLNCYETTISFNRQRSAWEAKGNMSEAALKVAACKGHFQDGGQSATQLVSECPRDPDLEISFSSSRKMSATFHRLPSSKCFSTLRLGSEHTYFAILKGAPDRVMPHLKKLPTLKGDALIVGSAAMSQAESRLIESQNLDLANKALRALIMAICPLKASEVEALRKSGEPAAKLKMLLGNANLTLLSIWGIFDPPRGSVPPSIQECHEAGIRVVMITGDQRPTAVAIGKLIGLLGKGMPDEKYALPCSKLHHDNPDSVRQYSDPKLQKSLSRSGSRDLSIHDPKGSHDQHEKEYKCREELDEMTSHVCIWSRAQPTDKVAIVESLVKQGNVAAMTGDGVNDAPALTSAEIGVAMGINGTEVTKNAADMILLDDNFSTIVAAVKEGRKIYGNVQKYVLFNLSAKASECACLLTAIIFNLPMPIWGLQQLCNMVVTHIIPPMTIAFEDAEDYTMKIPPRQTKNDLVLNRLHMMYRWFPFVLCYAVLMMSSLTIGVWLHTGFVHVNRLVGSSVLGAIESKTAACALAGQLNANGKFVPDVLPYHCRCYIL